MKRDGGTQKTSFEIGKDLHRRARIRALEEGIEFQELIGKALEMYLRKASKKGDAS